MPRFPMLDGAGAANEIENMNSHNVSLWKVALIPALVILALLSSSASTPLPASRQARVVLMTGEVRIDGREADVGQALAPVVQVETGPRARCDIVFGGGNAISFGQNTRARIDFSSEAVAIKLNQGVVTSVLHKLEKLLGRPGFDITTPQALAAVRGTSFCVWCSGDETYACACNGSVHFEASDGSHGESVTAAHHAGRTFTKRAGAIAVEPAGILFHNDASVESVAKDIGYTIDWTKADD